MQDNGNLTLRAALRVLTAITEGSEPNTSDAEIIRRLFPTRPLDPLDELACAVVRMSVKQDGARAGRGASRQAG